MGVPEWVEIIPHTQDGKAGVVVRTKPGVCSDGKTRGLFAVGDAETAMAVDALVCHESVGKFKVSNHGGGG